MTRLSILLLCCYLTFDCIAQENLSMSLREAVDYAQKNDLGVQNSLMTIEDAEQQIIEQRSIGLPKLDGIVDYQYYFQIPQISFPNPVTGERTNVSFALANNFNVGLNASALVFDGSYIIGLRAAKLYRDYTQQDHIAQQIDLKNRVKLMRKKF